VLTQSPIDLIPHAAELLGREEPVCQDPREQEISRTLENLVDDVIDGLSGGIATHGSREIQVRPALRLVSDVFLCLECPKHGQNGRVGKLVGELVADLCNGRGAAIPEHGHDIELAVGEQGHRCGAGTQGSRRIVDI